MIKDIEITALQDHIANGDLLVDLREYYEQPRFAFPNHLEIPTSELSERLAEIPKQGNVIIYCHSGVRSADVVAVLQEHYGYQNLYNLEGGAVMIAMTLPEMRK